MGHLNARDDGLTRGLARSDRSHRGVHRPMLDALVIAPHPDDAELGMGGTIVRLIGQGWSVGILDLTSGEPTPLGPIETRAREPADATRALGVSWRRNLGLPNRSLEATLAHRRELAAVFRE